MIQQQIQADIVAAMKSKDSDTLRSLRGLKSAIGIKQTEKSANTELTDDEVLAVIQKQIKSRREVAETYKSQNRLDLLEIEEFEIKTFEKYLPEQLTADDVEPIVKEVVAELGATSKKEMGAIMKHPKILALNGQIDKGTISTLIQAQFS